MPAPTTAEINRQAIQTAEKLQETLTLAGPGAIQVGVYIAGNPNIPGAIPQIILQPEKDNYSGMLEAIKRLNVLVTAGLNYSPDLE